ncbi:glycosyltransferase [Desulfosporosinus sp. HMP52]|uniref:glycosyltransferase family 2 protein n=1 Tax=Desulfosporosinus sp. HMP52 TaxID=1487923 RepID=UPI00051FA6B8|nr:glycosyl transferase [Desulfosporosinus sp. HMP52]KGK85747.1 glycosyltransferase [Desulfosporosinus sp. HMP52]
MDYEVVIISHRPHLCRGAQLCLKAHNYRVFDGTNYPSFSKLVNDCITSSKYEIIIVCNEKARPTPQAVEKILVMLNEGWGIVALFRFGFFGFKKDLIRRIGFFDERFIGGGYEDVDFARRLKEANIGYYESEEIEYIYLPTSWNYEKTNLSRNQYFRKWKEEANQITRQLAEEDYPYDLGPFQNTKFIEFEKSVLLPYHGNIKEIKMQTELC